jgi:hypothetical protein
VAGVGEGNEAVRLQTLKADAHRSGLHYGGEMIVDEAYFCSQSTVFTIEGCLVFAPTDSAGYFMRGRESPQMHLCSTTRRISQFWCLLLFYL